MKPLNYDDPSCNPVSSTCVIWQGPDLDCISLCKGDSINEVVAALATELCSILDTLDVTTYDISCLDLKCCEPENFHDLVQLLIEKICALNACTFNPDGSCKVSAVPVPGGCPDCEVPIAPAFFYKNALGDTVKTMQVVDYAKTIGNKVSELIVTINIINNTIIQMQSKITALENTPAPVFVLPKVTPVCVLPKVSTDMNIVLAVLEQQFCILLGATGNSTELFTNIAKQCLGLSSTQALSSSSTMAGLPGWNINPSNAAQSIGNLWVTLCDLRTAVRTIQINCCPTGCDGILVNLFAEVVGTSVKLYFTGTLPADFVNCTGATVFTITDSLGGTINTVVDIAGNMNNPTGVSIQLSGTPVDPSVNLTITGDPCFTNTVTGSVCKSCLEYVVNVDACCPDLAITPSIYSTLYEFGTCSGDITYTVELWNEGTTTMLQSAVYTVSGVQTINGAFAALTGGTVYKIRIKTTVSGVDNNCAFTSFTTNPDPCDPPTDVTAIIIE